MGVCASHPGYEGHRCPTDVTYDIIQSPRLQFDCQSSSHVVEPWVHHVCSPELYLDLHCCISWKPSEPSEKLDHSTQCQKGSCRLCSLSNIVIPWPLLCCCDRLTDPLNRHPQYSATPCSVPNDLSCSLHALVARSAGFSSVWMCLIRVSSIALNSRAKW